jgi:hypothetical protein
MTVKLKLNNVVINGAFDYWQRNTSFAAIANNAYNADRFHYAKAGAMVHTVARSTDVPASSSSVYSLLATTTTIDAAIAATDFVCVLQHIEGNVLRSFEGKKMVMTFWVKAFKTGTYCVSLRNGTGTRSLVLEYTINASNTWEKKTVRFTHDTTGTWDYTTGIGLTAVFVIASGSTFNTTANTWQNGQFFATANQVNGVDSLSNTFQLADICMVEDNEGQTREPDFMYAGRDYFEELQLCHRYYEKSYDIETPPGTITNAGVRSNTVGTASTNSMLMSVSFDACKRVIPTIVCYNAATGAANSVNTNGGADTPQILYAGTRSVNIGADNGISKRAVYPHFTADAEL